MNRDQIVKTLEDSDKEAEFNDFLSWFDGAEAIAGIEFVPVKVTLTDYDEDIRTDQYVFTADGLLLAVDRTSDSWEGNHSVSLENIYTVKAVEAIVYEREE